MNRFSGGHVVDGGASSDAGFGLLIQFWLSWCFLLAILGPIGAIFAVLTVGLLNNALQGILPQSFLEWVFHAEYMDTYDPELWAAYNADMFRLFLVSIGLCIVCWLVSRLICKLNRGSNAEKPE